MEATILNRLTPRRIVTAIALCLASGVGSNFAHAQASNMFELLESDAAQSKDPAYTLPKQKLTYEISAFQILSDLALNRGEFKIAYDGYMHLAKTTRDPRYAERAYWVAALANDTEAAANAAQVLKTIAPTATLGQELTEQLHIKKILDKSEAGQLREAHREIKVFLKSHPNHEVGLTLLADVAGKLKLDGDTLYAFEKLYALTPEDPEAMNNLGYFLVDHNLRLNQAEKLITAALKASPNAPHIIDSAAWLAYRKNDLKKALPLAQRAYSLSKNADVALHLAEILWVTGDKPAARELFDEIKSAPANKDNTALQTQLQETLRRLGVGLDVK